MASRRPARPSKPSSPKSTKPAPEPDELEKPVADAAEEGDEETDGELVEETAAEAPLPKNTLPFEIDPKKVEDSLKKFRDQLLKFTKKGRYTKVRFKFRGKQLLPDLPLAAVMAVEGATFYWTGLLRLLVFNLAGRAVIDVELVHDSEKRITAGKEALLSGDLDVALAAFREALEMDPENPVVHLNLGVAYKLKGQKEIARMALQKAKSLDGHGPTGMEADRLLTGLGPPAKG
jgi:tetratricopeptide (TPR) repeat protein